MSHRRKVVTFEVWAFNFRSWDFFAGPVLWSDFRSWDFAFFRPFLNFRSWDFRHFRNFP